METVLRVAFVYAFMLIALRLMGKREFGERWIIETVDQVMGHAGVLGIALEYLVQNRGSLLLLGESAVAVHRTGRS